MQRYILTSPIFTGKLTFGYDAEGYLFYFHNEADLTEPQRKAILNRMPYVIEDLHKLTEGKQATLTELPEDLSFERFWNEYDRKIHPHRCKPLWEKLSDADRMVCLLSIRAYNKWVDTVPGRKRADPEAFLKRQYYLTDWKKIK